MKFLDNMEVICLKCNLETTLPFEVNYNYFICPNCFSCNEKSTEVFLTKENFPKPFQERVLTIGKLVTLYNTEYTVFNFIEKKTKEGDIWYEYELKSKDNLSLFITDEGGNWIIEKEIEKSKVSGNSYRYYNEVEFSLFEKGWVYENTGCGFFEYKLTNETIYYEDYVSPPQVLSLEKENGENDKYYLGEHISRNEVLKIFDLKYLPSKTYIGSAQPFYYNIIDVVKIFLSFAILTLIIHLTYYSYSKNELILERELNLTESYTTDIISLRGAIAPLTINISSNVDNSWVATDFSLTNIKTAETVYFSKDIEYYYGYSEGENWTEGDKNEEFSICGVSAGDYKITVNPTNDETNTVNNILKISVYWDKKHNWNFMFVILTFLVLIIILYYIKNSFESNRWSDSPYSPYTKDED